MVESGFLILHPLRQVGFLDHRNPSILELQTMRMHMYMRYRDWIKIAHFELLLLLPCSDEMIREPKLFGRTKRATSQTVSIYHRQVHACDLKSRLDRV